MMMRILNDNTTSKAAKLMTKFYPSYVQMKHLEQKLDFIKGSLEQTLLSSEMKRIVVGDMVCRFVAKNKYEIDYAGMNEYLYDLGVLPYTNVIKKALCTDTELDFLEMFRFPNQYSVVPRFNKANAVPVLDYKVAGSIEELTQLYKQFKEQHTLLIGKYETQKKAIEKCRILTSKKKVSYELGSISLVKKQPLYDLGALYQWGVEDILLNCSRPSSTLLQPFILKGIVRENELLQFKKRIDVDLNFMVMTLEAETKMFDHYQNRVLTISKNLA